jgi:hypothetical protein
MGVQVPPRPRPTTTNHHQPPRRTKVWSGMCVFGVRDGPVSSGVPAVASKGSFLGASRTTTYDYAVSGVPTETRVTEANSAYGTYALSMATDSVGNMTRYVDAWGIRTWHNYDRNNREVSSQSVKISNGQNLDIRGSWFDSFNRPSQQFIDNISVVTPTYDEFSRVASLTYVNGTTASIGRDTTGAVTDQWYRTSGGSTV